MLKKILIGLALLLALLFTVQIVDTALHKDDYAKVDSALNAINKAVAEHQSCNNETTEILTQAFAAPPAESQINKILLDKPHLAALYRNCDELTKQIAAVNLDPIGFSLKKKQFEKYKQKSLEVYGLQAHIVQIVMQCGSFDALCKNELTDNTRLFLNKCANLTELYNNTKSRFDAAGLISWLPIKIAEKLNSLFSISLISSVYKL